MKDLKDTFELSNGYKIPCIGFGTWKTKEGKDTFDSVKTAIETGYRHVDTAAVYGNEVSVGEAVRASGIAREDVFITSKVWNESRGYDKAMKAFEETLTKLGTDYLDLYLIHWPASSSQFDNWEELNRETWRAMIEIYKSKRARSIGISNFMPHHMKAIMDSEILPMINQIEYHPGQTQDETVRFCKGNGILLEAWSPLGNGRLLGHPVIVRLAEKYGATPAQIMLRWCLQNGVLPLTKSLRPERIKENVEVFGFEIGYGDMRKIDSIEYYGGSGQHPDTIDF